MIAYFWSALTAVVLLMLSGTLLAIVAIAISEARAAHRRGLERVRRGRIQGRL